MANVHLVDFKDGDLLLPENVMNDLHVTENDKVVFEELGNGIVVLKKADPNDFP